MTKTDKLPVVHGWNSDGVADIIGSDGIVRRYTGFDFAVFKKRMETYKYGKKIWKLIRWLHRNSREQEVLCSKCHLPNLTCICAKSKKPPVPPIDIKDIPRLIREAAHKIHNAGYVVSKRGNSFQVIRCIGINGCGKITALWGNNIEETHTFTTCFRCGNTTEYRFKPEDSK